MEKLNLKIFAGRSAACSAVEVTEPVYFLKTSTFTPFRWVAKVVPRKVLFSVQSWEVPGMDASLSSDRWTRWFWMFALGHVAVWTLVPTLTQPNAPLDTIEMLYWGHEWQWGYYKHPPLPAWLANGFSQLFGNAVWPTYLLCQACILACFWAVWQIVRDRCQPWVALAAVALLEACAFYNYTTVELNNNMLRRGLTALTVLFIYWAITRRHVLYWAAGGLFVALGMLSKYDHAILVLSIVIFSLAVDQVRPLWRTAGPWVLVAVSLALFAPHAWWMIENDLITLRYVQDRTQTDTHWIERLSNPAKFLGEQFVSVGGILLLAVGILGWRWKWRTAPDDATRLTRDYLAAVVLGPLSLAMLFSAVSGGQIRSMLGAPMWIFLPALLLLSFERRRESPIACRNVALAGATLSLILAIGLAVHNTVGTSLHGKYLRIDYPGEALADEVEARWNQVAEGDPPIVAGTWWPAANISVYADRRLSVYPDCKADWAPWTSDQMLRSQGGVLVWEVDETDDAQLDQWLARFPEAMVQPPIEIVHTKAPHIEPLRVGIAIIPPAAYSEPQPPTQIAEQPTLHR